MNQGDRDDDYDHRGREVCLAQGGHWKEAAPSRQLNIVPRAQEELTGGKF